MFDTIFDPLRQDLTLGIVGTGLMGRGIAQIAAQAGLHVRLCDSREGAAGEAREAIAQTFAKLASKGKLSAAESDRVVRYGKLLGRATELLGAPFQVGIQPFALNRQGNVIRQRAQHQHISLVESIQPVALKIEHSQDAVLYL